MISIVTNLCHLLYKILILKFLYNIEFKLKKAIYIKLMNTDFLDLDYELKREDHQRREG